MKLAFIAVALVVLAFASLSCSSGGDSGVQLPELTPLDEALGQQAATIAAQTSYIRGLEFPEDLNQGTLTREQLTEYNEQAALEAREESEDEIAAWNTAFRLLHMIGPKDDLLDIFTNFESNLVLGFYSIEDDKLVLVADAPRQLSLDEQSTLSHEYVHAMQDAAFDLDKLRKRAEEEDEDRSNTEYADTIDALIEGDAELAQARFEATRPAGGMPAAPPASLGDAQAAYDKIPPAIRRYLSFSYSFGQRFVQDLYDEGGWEAVNEAFDNPPLSEEQLIHLDKYKADEKPRGLKLRDLSKDFGDGWQQEDDSVFGQYDVYNWLYSTINVPDLEAAAFSAAIGWGGGRMAAYSRPEDGRVLLHIALSWDNEFEAFEFYSAFGAYVTTIDRKPTIVDKESGQIVAWDAKNEAGRAWIDGTSFQMLVATNPYDLAIALQAVEAPDKIPQSGWLLR